jgi:IMP cyclohydrolase
MAQLDLEPSLDTLNANVAARAELTYVGREIWMGVAGHLIMQVYGLSGRSDPSRAREFQILGGDTIRTAAPGKTDTEMQQIPDADLIYYHAMHGEGDVHVVSNGAQTGSVRRGIARNRWTTEEALRLAPKVKQADGSWVDLSSYEPDPLTTPRIAGAVDLRRDSHEELGLSVVRRVADTFRIKYAGWSVFHLDDMPDGVAYGIRTYSGNDGSTEPFDDEQPYTLPLPNTAEEAADMYIDTTPRENLVAVAVKEIDRRSGAVRFVIRNGLQTAA